MPLITATNGEWLTTVPALIAEEEPNDWEWTKHLFGQIWEFTVCAVKLVVEWFALVIPSLGVWVSQLAVGLFQFIRTHPTVFHAIAWSIFFGPIIVLVPCLLLLELLILSLLYLSFAAHGALPGSIEARFDSLKEYFMDFRESLFASVESKTAIFNKWTVDHPIFFMARLAAGVVGSLLLLEIYTGW
ncbi:hypothetical protein CVT24_000778 [Panaeolus cyanescens]|uniref:Uncharacterized protein n=1 Tax=Panaeolus cyanescens TaxID=181874 RepID=A0A409YCM1_9AGAR|nr:hypothetical protein CVT24_000778 [Panaeolus cyanescens]